MILHLSFHCLQFCTNFQQFSDKIIATAMDANSEEYATKVWRSNSRALWFLIWLGLEALSGFSCA